MTTTPTHLAADRCYVCGGEDHGATFTNTGRGHDFWSNAAAKQHFDAEDRRRSVRYSNGTTTPEANYVAQTRPY